MKILERTSRKDIPHEINLNIFYIEDNLIDFASEIFERSEDYLDCIITSALKNYADIFISHSVLYPDYNYSLYLRVNCLNLNTLALSGESINAIIPIY